MTEYPGRDLVEQDGEKLYALRNLPTIYWANGNAGGWMTVYIDESDRWLNWQYMDGNSSYSTTMNDSFTSSGILTFTLKPSQMGVENTIVFENYHSTQERQFDAAG